MSKLALILVPLAAILLGVAFNGCGSMMANSSTDIEMIR